MIAIDEQLVARSWQGAIGVPGGECTEAEIPRAAPWQGKFLLLE